VTGARQPTANSITISTAQFLTVTGAPDSLKGSTTSERSVATPDTLAFSFNGNTNAYTVRNAERSAIFGPNDFRSETSIPDFYPSVLYRTINSSATDFLILYKEANATPRIPTDFAAYGTWQHSEGRSADTTRSRLDYFVYGEQTPAASMPRTGRVTYRLTGAGNVANEKQLYFAKVFQTVSVDFATGQIDTYLSMTGDDLIGGGFGGLVSAQFRAQISGASAEGPLRFDIAIYSGNARLVFFGPNAENVGLVFSGASPFETFAGAGVGVTP
jgi:hypothetical protein